MKGLPQDRERVAASDMLREFHGLEGESSLARPPDGNDVLAVALAKQEEATIIRPGHARALERHERRHARNMAQRPGLCVEQPHVENLEAPRPLPAGRESAHGPARNCERECDVAPLRVDRGLVESGTAGQAQTS